MLLMAGVCAICDLLAFWFLEWQQVAHMAVEMLGPVLVWYIR